MAHGQSDLFATATQPDLFGPAPSKAYRPDPDKVRARPDHVLAEARAAETYPWSPTRTTLYRTIIPDMIRWLPDEEAVRYRAEFEAEMARLKPACPGPEDQP